LPVGEPRHCTYLRRSYNRWLQIKNMNGFKDIKIAACGSFYRANTSSALPPACWITR
jgi:hypothetical protein